MNYLCSYKPIITSIQGQNAVKQYHFPPFIDGSCRREPDFESEYPSITALCRGAVFAPRLLEGDVIVYITVKGSYLGITPSHWRLTAILKVTRRFESHDSATAWYQMNSLPLPANCMVPENKPAILSRTSGPLNADFRKKTSKLSAERLIDLWDSGYQKRANKWGVFLMCNPTFLEMYNPPILTAAVMTELFGSVPFLLNPPRISDEALARLIKLLKIKT